jgi:hypothetical protein
MARSVFLSFNENFKHALTLTVISITAPALFYLPTSMSVACGFSIGIPRGVRMAFFQMKSLSPDLLLPTAAKSKHKFFWKKFVLTSFGC